MIGVAFREQRVELVIFDEAEGLVVALALLVLDDTALDIELLLRHRAEQVAHAIRFEEQGAIERAARDGLEIIGAVEPGRAVHVGRADLLHRLEIARVAVLGSTEHEMFEQVGEAGTALRLVLGADRIPDGDGDDGRLVILVHDHAQAVRQGEFLMRNVHRRHELLDRSATRCR